MRKSLRFKCITAHNIHWSRGTCAAGRRGDPRREKISAPDRAEGDKKVLSYFPRGGAARKRRRAPRSKAGKTALYFVRRGFLRHPSGGGFFAPTDADLRGKARNGRGFSPKNCGRATLGPPHLVACARAKNFTDFSFFVSDLFGRNFPAPPDLPLFCSRFSESV